MCGASRSASKQLLSRDRPTGLPHEFHMLTKLQLPTFVEDATSEIRFRSKDFVDRVILISDLAHTIDDQNDALLDQNDPLCSTARHRDDFAEDSLPLLPRRHHFSRAARARKGDEQGCARGLWLC